MKESRKAIHLKQGSETFLVKWVIKRLHIFIYISVRAKITKKGKRPIFLSISYKFHNFSKKYQVKDKKKGS